MDEFKESFRYPGLSEVDRSYRDTYSHSGYIDILRESSVLSLSYLKALQSQRDASFFNRGWGIKSKYLTERKQDRILDNEIQNRLADTRMYSAGSFKTQLGRDFSNVFGMTDLYEDTVGMFDLQKRTEIDTAKKLTSFFNATMTRQDLEGSQFKSLDMQNRLSAIMADPEKLRGRVSDSELATFKENAGFSPHKGLSLLMTPWLAPKVQNGAFTMDEQRQLMMKAAAVGEYTGLEATSLVNPKTGKREYVGYATTERDKERIREQTVTNQALASQKVLANVSEVQQEFGIEDAGDAFDLAKVLSGSQKVSNLKKSDITKISALKEQLNVSTEAITEVLTMGDDLAKNLGLSQAQGRAISINRLRDTKNLQSLGVVNQSTVTSIGGENELANKYGRALEGIATSESGKRYRGARSLIEMVRKEKGDSQADSYLERIKREKATTGEVTRSTATRIARDAGITVSETDIDTFFDSRKSLVEKNLSGINVEGEQVDVLLERMRSSKGTSTEYKIRQALRDPVTRDFANSVGPEVLRDLIVNKKGSKQALTIADTRMKASGLAEKLLSIREEYSDPSEIKGEIDKVIKKYKVEDKVTASELMDIDASKSSAETTREIHKIIESKDRPGILSRTFENLRGTFRFSETPEEKDVSIRKEALESLSAKERSTYKIAEETGTLEDFSVGKKVREVEAGIRRSELEQANAPGFLSKLFGYTTSAGIKPVETNNEVVSVLKENKAVLVELKDAIVSGTKTGANATRGR